MKAAYILISIFFLFSCEENNETIIDSNNLLLGNWSAKFFVNETITFNRVANLSEEAYGVSFKDEGVFIERSSGFCGTPPISYFNIEGGWLLPEATLIALTITTDFSRNFNWRIISLTEDTLVVRRELTEQEKDHNALMVLFNEIQDLAYSVSCTDASNWLYAAYGAKACGGSQGYIPYPKEINSADFLQKIKNYTEAEHQYNIKWSVISSCDIPTQPTGVECQNGFPNLKY